MPVNPADTIQWSKLWHQYFAVISGKWNPSTLNPVQLKSYNRFQQIWSFCHMVGLWHGCHQLCQFYNPRIPRWNPGLCRLRKPPGSDRLFRLEVWLGIWHSAHSLQSWVERKRFYFWSFLTSSSGFSFRLETMWIICCFRDSCWAAPEEEFIFAFRYSCRKLLIPGKQTIR